MLPKVTDVRRICQWCNLDGEITRGYRISTSAFGARPGPYQPRVTCGVDVEHFHPPVGQSRNAVCDNSKDIIVRHVN